MRWKRWIQDSEAHRTWASYMLRSQKCVCVSNWCLHLIGDFIEIDCWTMHCGRPHHSWPQWLKTEEVSISIKLKTNWETVFFFHSPNDNKTKKRDKTIIKTMNHTKRPRYTYKFLILCLFLCGCFLFSNQIQSDRENYGWCHFNFIHY